MFGCYFSAACRDDAKNYENVMVSAKAIVLIITLYRQ